MLDNREVELVVIATRHDLHATLVLGALRAGKHVLVEKPLALDSSGARGDPRVLRSSGRDHVRHCCDGVQPEV